MGNCEIDDMGRLPRIGDYCSPTLVGGDMETCGCILAEQLYPDPQASRAYGQRAELVRLVLGERELRPLERDRGEIDRFPGLESGDAEGGNPCSRRSDLQRAVTGGAERDSAGDLGA